MQTNVLTKIDSDTAVFNREHLYHSFSIDDQKYIYLTLSGKLGIVDDGVDVEHLVATDFNDTAKYQVADDGLKSITLIVSNQCNLRCKYCYEDFSSAKNMTSETSKSAIDIYLEKSNRKSDDALKVIFFGGEPMLAYQTIVDAVRYCNQKADKPDYKKMKRQLELAFEHAYLIKDSAIKAKVVDALNRVYIKN